MMFLDGETQAHRPGCVAPPVVVLNVDGTVYHWTQARPVVEHMLYSSEVLVGHYIASDMTFIAGRWPDLIPAIFAKYDRLQITCTIVREKLCDIFDGLRDTKSRKYALGEVAKRRAGLDMPAKDNGWQLRFGELENCPDPRTWPAEALAYVRDDVHVLPAIFAAQEQYAQILGNQWLQARDDFGLAVTAAYGIATNPAKVARLKSVIETSHAHLGAYLRREGLLRAKRKRGPEGEQQRDTKAAKAIMVAVMGDAVKRTAPSKTAPEGNIVLDDTACRESGDARLIAYAEYSSLNTVVSKDVPLLERGVIHTRFDSLLETGRTSTSNPNTQNLKVKQYGSGICVCGAWEQDHNEKRCPLRVPGMPDRFGHDLEWPRYRATETVGVRECIAPRPGHVFIVSDFGGLELCTWARVCLDWFGFSDMADTLKANRDAHLVMAADILEESYEQCAAGLKAEKDSKQLGRYYDARQCGKAGNFGCPGGLGPNSLIAFAFANQGIRIELPQSKRIIAAWKRNYRESGPYLQRMNALSRQPNPKIEQVRSGRIRGLDPRRAYTQGGNTMFQGLGADIAKDAHYHVAREAYCCPASPLYGSRPVMFVHDETVCEVREDRATEACDRLGAVMRERASLWLEDVPIKTEECVTRVYSKLAHSKRGPDGRLSIWAP